MRFRIPLVIAAAFAIALAGAARADDASDLKAKLEALQKQMDAVKAQMDQMQRQREEEMKKPAAPAAAPAAEAKGEKSPIESLYEKLTKGFYGSLDVSVDMTTKGMSGFIAHGGYSSGGFGTPITGPTNIKMANCNPAWDTGAIMRFRTAT
jgi:hypothetical protein